MRNVKNFPSGRTEAFAEAALRFEITASIAGLKKHIYSYITASEEISGRGQEVSTHTHSLMWDTRRKNVGRNLGRILDVLYRFEQRFLSLNLTLKAKLWFRESLKISHMLDSVQLQPKVSVGELTKVKQNTCMSKFSSWFSSTLWSAACLSLSLSLSCRRWHKGTDSSEKSMVTRLVARFTGGSWSSGSRGRGGTLTECLLINLSLQWVGKVTEQGEGGWEVWRRRWEDSEDVQECR